MEKKKKGDRVIALSDSVTGCQKRKKGETYIVNAVMYCMSCGTQYINIGEKVPKSCVVNCGNCDNEQPAKGLNWSNSDNFSIIADKSVEELLQEAVENEDWEKAITLRDLMKKQ